jgi:chromosome segregation ATPase
VTTLASYSEKLDDLDHRQKILLDEVNEANEALEKETHPKLSAVLPEIKDQERVVTNIEKRAASARMRLEEQSDTVIVYGSLLTYLVGGYRLYDCAE